MNSLMLASFEPKMRRDYSTLQSACAALAQFPERQPGMNFLPNHLLNLCNAWITIIACLDQKQNLFVSI